MSYVDHVTDMHCDIFLVCIYIYIYILKRAGTSDILTFVYTTGLLFFGLTFAGTV